MFTQTNGYGYVESSRSGVLPAVDLAHLATFVTPDAHQTATVKAYLRSLHER